MMDWDPDLPIEVERVRLGLDAPARDGGFVLYWMQQARRSRENPALELAIHEANRRRLPLLVLYCLPETPQDAPAHQAFMLAGLAEAAAEIRDRGAAFVLREGAPELLLPELARDAAALVMDEGRLREEVRWREAVLKALSPQESPPAVLLVETEAVVPPALASNKDEWSAATFRRKILPHIARFLRPLPRLELRRPARGLGLDSGDACFRSPSIPAPPASIGYRMAEQRIPLRPGSQVGIENLRFFLEHKLDLYPADRNDPSLEGQSFLSPYFHYGQLSPVYAARETLGQGGIGADAFLEQLIVRRELAVNFLRYNPRYDAYEGLPPWARQSLEQAASDRREYLYDEASLEAAHTHDPYWNAAQDELVLTGRMHNYMRMYWGKKILEWSPSPEAAFALALRLNDRYALDGRDPNSYAGIAWCFGKHDRPWGGRPVYGTIRSMTAGGLRRKYDIEAYVRRIDQLRRH